MGANSINSVFTVNEDVIICGDSIFSWASSTTSSIGKCNLFLGNCTELLFPSSFPCVEVLASKDGDILALDVADNVYILPEGETSENIAFF